MRGAGAARAMAAAALLWGAAAPAFAQQFLTEEEALRLAFPGAERIERKSAAATNEQRAEIARRAGLQEAERFFDYYEGTAPGGAPMGYAVVGNVLGKHRNITYLLGFAPDHAVSAMEILVYRESYGYEIRRDAFRKQFFGTGPDDPIRLGREIRNITGATISCRSMIRAVTVQRAYVEVLLPKATAQQKGAALSPPPSRRRAGEGGDPESAFRRRARLLMGTILDVQAYAPTSGAADAAIDAAFAEVARIESLLSTWRADTPLARLNRDGRAEVGAEAAALLARSRALTAATGGAFDVTAGPLIRLWRTAAERDAPPAEDEIAEARRAVGEDGLLIEGGAARFARPGMRVDLDGVGKGYALDRAAAVLRAHGVRSALLNFGGQILATDPPPGRPGWEVFVRDPRAQGATIAALTLARGSIATSADDERGLEVAGARVSHLVDPRTGRPASAVLSASVLARSAEEADAWTKAFFVLGRGAESLARGKSVRALLLARDGALIDTGGVLPHAAPLSSRERPPSKSSESARVASRR